MTLIKKKAWPEFFEKFASGERTLELRLADFDLRSGDELVLQEYNPQTKTYPRAREGTRFSSGARGSYTGRELNFLCERVEHSVQNPLQFYNVEDVKRHGFWIIQLKKK